MQKSDKKTFALTKGEHLIQFSVESRIEPKVISSYWDTQSQNVEIGDGMDSLAEVAIKRITFKGSIFGGAFECQKCPTGTVSARESFHCLPCIAGSQASADQSSCTPCKEGFFNQNERGTCQKCPPFTSSRRHETDAVVFTQPGKKADVEAATHCVLDKELHVL